MKARPDLMAKISYLKIRIALLALAVVWGPIGCGSSGINRHSPSITGMVMGGSGAISGATVTLYEATTTVSKLSSAVTDAGGNFVLYYIKPTNSNALLYLTATGGTVAGASGPNGAIKLSAVLGLVSTDPMSATINELTTVASAYSMAQFAGAAGISGPSPGLRNASSTVANLVDVQSGQLGTVIQNAANGSSTTTLATLNALADILAGCVESATPAVSCGNLFAAVTPPGEAPPTDTWRATVLIALNPANNVNGIFKLIPASLPYTPAIGTLPDSWVLALRYTGGGMDAPGGMAIDAFGNVWTENNFEFGSSPNMPGLAVTELGPNGAVLSANGFSGGGIFGPGWGISLDQTGNVWVGNFKGNSISKLDSTGSPLSPSTGFTQGNLANPQATVVDLLGSIWIANNDLGGTTGSITVYLAGDPTKALNFTAGGIDHPFDIAIDATGNVWATNAFGNSVTKLNPTGLPFPGSPFTGNASMLSPHGMGIDQEGNVWVANLGSEDGSVVGTTVTELTSSGAAAPNSPFTGGGIKGPWGLAIDGADHVWIANFLGVSVSELCGTNTADCPKGVSTGQPISPPTGFLANGALQHLTAVRVDSSGNVWVCNNIADLATQAGGNAMVELIGIAAPVKTPQFGPNQPAL
jgi:streptogramin lyase